MKARDCAVSHAGSIVAGRLLCAGFARGQTAGGPVRITLDEAIQMALKHNHNLLAARTTIQQSQAKEVTANLRPNPTLFHRLGIPAARPPRAAGLLDYLHDSTEADLGLSYLFERGKKRQHRLQAAKDATAVTRSQVADNERSLTFQVAQLFINVQLAESTLDLAAAGPEELSENRGHQRSDSTKPAASARTIT